jgi:hypothetical protein
LDLTYFGASRDAYRTAREGKAQALLDASYSACKTLSLHKRALALPQPALS